MVTIRPAVMGDLPAIVALQSQLFDDPGEDFAAHREAYERAFAQIVRDPRQQLLVAERDGVIAGSLVLVIVPNLGRRGRPYAIIENVIVDAALRRTGLGAQMMHFAEERARAAGCYKIGLTSRLHRKDAHKFYEGIGYTPASIGFRLDL
jgi:GNAT superfamily N-acetyltransferase